MERGTAETGTVVTVEAAVAAAAALHRDGRLAEAEAIYGAILAAAPDTADALHFYGLLKHATGRTEAAIEMIGRAVQLVPDHAGFHNNLGNIHREQSRLDLAAAAYDAALALEPGSAEIKANAEAAARAWAKALDDEAEARRATAADAGDAAAWRALAAALVKQGRVREAIRADAACLALGPDDARTRHLLVVAYGICDERDKALAVLDRILREDPDDAVAHHHRAALLGDDVPERASDTYVERTFDAFAGSFDGQLEKLSYRAPQRIADAVLRLLGAPQPRFAMLDAGCGTGLCGPYLKPWAARLTGVDLSAEMLKRAASRGGYDALEQAELTQFLSDRPDSFDLVASADTLCYFGPLQAVLRAARGALRDGGAIAFTVEANADPRTVALGLHGRYSHGAEHVRAALEAAGFADCDLREVVLRSEADTPVKGFVATARRA